MRSRTVLVALVAVMVSGVETRPIGQEGQEPPAPRPRVIVGRSKDMVIRGGENISPGEVEETLLAHPAVADAAAIGLPSRQWGETVSAVIVKAKDAQVTEDELRDWVTSHLRSSRSPEHVVFRDELPYNDMGKLLRRVLKAELAHLGETNEQD